MNAHSDTPDAATWARLSPLLDEALDLPPPERATWLAALQARAPQDAALLRNLLERQEAASREDFLAGTAQAGAAPPAAGHRLGPWTIEAPLGEGGMASVWLARRSDGRHDGQAAIKLMHGRLHGTQASQRFEREGRILARLEHPHIARLLDAGVASDGEGGQPYLVLELVRGEPIDRWCDEHRLDVEARLRLFVDVVQAVAAAHAQLVVHRDLKPGNVMVDGQGQVKLLDFGIASLLDEGAGQDGAASAAAALTRTGQRAFTPAWAAPEQVRGEPVSTATDVWALGVLLCQLLTGRHPSGLPWTSDLTAWMQAAALPDIQRPSELASAGADAAALAAARGMQPASLARRLHGELDQIVRRALAEEPSRRYGSAQALADDLMRHLRNEPVSAVADTVGYRATKFVRRNRLMVGAASTTLLVLMAGVVGTAWQALEAQRQRDAARSAQAEAVSQAALADQQRAQALANASEAARQRVSAEVARERALTEAARAEAETQRAEAESLRAQTENRRAQTAQALAQTEATAARDARAETEMQLLQTRAQRAEARYMARASAASADVLSTLLADIGASGQPLPPEQLLEKARGLVDKNYTASPALQSELLINLGVRYQQLRLSDRQRQMRELGEAAARRSADANAIANALCAAPEPDANQGRAAQVQTRLHEARQLMAAINGEPRLTVRLVCLNAEIFLASARSDHPEAIRLARLAVQLFEEADQRDGLPYVTALGNLAFQHQRAGQSKEAFALYVYVGQVMDATGRSDTTDRLTVLANVGIQQSNFGEHRASTDTFAQILTRAHGADLSQPVGDPGFARSYGIGLFQLHRLEEAVRWLAYAQQKARQGGAVPVELDACVSLARSHLRAGQLVKTDEVLKGCEATLAGNAVRQLSHGARFALARAEWLLARGETVAAHVALQTLAAQVPDAPSPAHDRDRVSHLPAVVSAALAVGEVDEARRRAESYLASAERVARVPEQSAHVGRAWALLGDVQQRQGQPGQTLASRQRALPILQAALGAEHPETRTLEALLSARP
ncbi:MAG: protein kinase [Rubrivivax sp.]|nr:protein kinase [Rubrivivax sp.]